MPFYHSTTPFRNILFAEAYWEDGEDLREVKEPANLCTEFLFFICSSCRELVLSGHRTQGCGSWQV